MAKAEDTGGRPLSRTEITVRLVVLTLGTFAVLTPVLWTVLTSLKTAQQTLQSPPVWLFTPQWGNFAEVLQLVPFQNYALNTAVVVTGVVVGTLLSCSFSAYGFARLRARGRNAIFGVLMATMMLPSTVTLVPTYIVFNKIGWLNTFLPLIVPAFFGSAFFIFMFRQFYLSIPKEVEEAARIDGAGYVRIWWSIFLPLSMPVIATVTVFTFVGTYNDFFGPLIYLTDESKWTISVALSSFGGSPKIGPQLHMLSAATMIAAAPSIVVFLLAQRYYVNGISVAGVNK
ncbi:MAG: carbohydrate ABC transporter permease [Propionibacteriaceae bacterium]|jgi:multiple sugar transport system permease protein/sn-glycerol 3-phosphate transport system permease protein|nr:carbohydrate ABC transporter permease [Propionibacteriaceae bacterium]